MNMMARVYGSGSDINFNLLVNRPLGAIRSRCEILGELHSLQPPVRSFESVRKLMPIFPQWRYCKWGKNVCSLCGHHPYDNQEPWMHAKCILNL